jgi:hypothetical protein
MSATIWTMVNSSSTKRIFAIGFQAKAKAHRRASELLNPESSANAGPYSWRIISAI